MRPHGGNNLSAAEAFYSAFKSDPQTTSIKAAIAYWNSKENSWKKKYAQKRDWRKLTIYYLGGHKKDYESTIKKYSGAYLKQGGHTAPRGDSADATFKDPRIVLIGDSNAFHLNSEYKKHYSTQDVRVLPLSWSGSGCRQWLEILTKVVEASGGKPITGSNKIADMARKIYKFNPTSIDVTSLGGNNINQSYTESKIQSHIGGCVKPLMKLIKRFDGTFAGPVPVGEELIGKTGERSNLLRTRINAAYEKAAREVGIPYWNPTANIAYDTAEMSKRKATGAGDGKHLTSKMAHQEFKSRKAFLAGNAAQAGGTSPRGDAEAKIQKSDKELLDWFYRRISDTQGKRFKSGWKMNDMLAMARRELEKIHGMPSGALDKPGGISTVDLPPPQVQEPSRPSPEEPPTSACPGGEYTSKYKNFKAQVPDFDFSTFYSELDKYFGSAEEVLKPQGKDCVFADEHYTAWVKLQKRKQQEAPYVAESFSLLHSLIREMKKRY